jgi:hypothetical protein
MFRRTAALGAALLVSAAGASAQILPSQQGADRPSETPSTSASTTSAPPAKFGLDGTWRFESICNGDELWTGTQTFSGSGGVFEGSGVTGTILDVTVSGRRVAFRQEYEFLGTTTENWAGTLSADATTVTGELSDSNGDNCSFTLRRQ